ncbi:MAG: hypothetical protein AAB355_01970 [Patescibacteria group bacterium]
MREVKNIENTIIETLESGPAGKADLIKGIGHKTGATAQGIYKALRKLKKEEVVTIHDKTISLSFIWIDGQISKYSKIAQTYQTPRRENYFLQLKSGEHITFKFRTLRELDLFWVHAFVLLEAQISKEIPMYAVVPHDWFSYARPSSDKVWTEKLEESARPQGVVITHPAPLDKKVVIERESKSNFLEFVCGENPFKQDERKYVNIIGQWVFEARLDNAINLKLVEYINKDFRDGVIGGEILEKLLDLPGTNTLKISRSLQRAELLIRKIKKYFTFKA